MARAAAKLSRIGEVPGFVGPRELFAHHLSRALSASSEGQGAQHRLHVLFSNALAHRLDEFRLLFRLAVLAAMAPAILTLEALSLGCGAENFFYFAIFHGDHISAFCHAEWLRE